MELDKTRIVVRERSYLDILDLALRVIRSRLLPLTAATLLGVVPFALFNQWALNAYFVPDLIDPEIAADERIGSWLAYLCLLTLLVLWQAPLATAPITLYLGQITFADEFDLRRATHELVRSLPQLVLLQVVLRGLLLPWVLTWFFPLVMWPYLTEVILLERSPLLRLRGKGMATTLSRITALHSPNTGDLMGRAFANALLAPLLTLALWASLWMIYGLMSESWALTAASVTLYLQVAVWATVALLAVARFLAYLDVRIRNEGWELELQMRAEGMRLAPPVTT